MKKSAIAPIVVTAAIFIATLVVGMCIDIDLGNSTKIVLTKINNLLYMALAYSTVWLVKVIKT